MAESIIILDDDEEDTPQPSSSSASSSSAQRLANHISPALKAQQPVPTHIIKAQRPVPTHIIKAQQPVPTRIITSPQPLPTHIITSPFASSKKDSHVLLAENQKLFKEFVEFCSTQTQDCPEVLQFLHAKHSKASPDFLCCAEFRNIVGRCLTRAQANPSKTFVYINELCTVLRQHSAKKRLTITKAESSATASAFATATSASLKADVKKEDKIVADDQPSTSGLQEEETNAEETEKERKKKKTSRRQIAYLENLLKVYNDEIRHLQEKELDLDDLAAEDSGYIQEHKLKRKMMKIYEKLCELKSCAPLTGRVIEQRIVCTATRYPEINKKVERFINSPQAHQNPPDYTDILEQVLKANTRHNLCLPRKKLNQIAQDAFRETVGHLQERRHLDLVYNFGSHLTDTFRTASMSDPALKDRDLQLKLRANREVALKGLEEVITKYAVRQEDTEDLERAKRLEKGKLRKGKSEKQEDKTKENGEVAAQENGEVAAQENGEVAAQENGEVAEQEEESEEEEEEDDASSDPDIEEEIQASTQHDGPDDDDDDDNEAEQASESANEEAGEMEMSASGSAEEGDEQKESVTSGLDVVSQDGNRGISPLSCEPSPVDCPTQSGTLVEPADAKASPQSSSVAEEEAADSSNHNAAITLVSTCSASTDAMSLPPSPVSNGVSSPVTRSAARGRKRKREVQESGNSPYVIHTIIDNGDVDISLDMVVSSSPPPQARSTRADSPSQDLVTSSQSTPPPKKNKVNVATQCDPDEVIVLSDSE